MSIDFDCAPIDIADREAVHSAIRAFRPELIVHSAAESDFPVGAVDGAAAWPALAQCAPECRMHAWARRQFLNIRRLSTKLTTMAVEVDSPIKKDVRVFVRIR
jgi:dTDP-4-dehydrorhamnose reductase